jgi:hypothetical protein
MPVFMITSVWSQAGTSGSSSVLGLQRRRAFVISRTMAAPREQKATDV